MQPDLDRMPVVEPQRLRAILLGAEPNDCGIRKLSARRVPASPLEWEVVIGASNHGSSEHRHLLRFTFAAARLGARNLVLPPGGPVETSFRFRSAQAGVLEVTLDSRDDYAPDNRVALELPALAPLPVQVYTSQPERWQALLTASPFVAPEFRQPGEYAPSGAAGRLVILDAFAPAPPDSHSLWIPAARNAVRLHVQRWNAEHPLAAGLFDQDVRLARAAVLPAGTGEVVVAETEQGPVLLASEDAGRKKLRLGFHPAEEGTENHLAVPLLFANVVRWVSPDLFRLTEVIAAAPGLIELRAPPGVKREQIQVQSAEVRDLPFTLVENRLRLFVARRGTVQITLPDQRLVYSLSLPEVGETRWRPPDGARQGVPPPAPGSPLEWPLWPWLALLGTAGLIAEWIWFGRRPVVASAAGGPAVATAVPQAEPAPQEVQP